MPKYTEIFVPGGFPRHTYYPRAELQLEQRLKEAQENLCKLVTVTGHTKSGKTVLTRKVFPREDAVWIDGGAVAEEDDFWGIVLEQLQLFQGTQVEAGSESSTTIGGKATAGANFLVAKGEGEVSGDITKSQRDGTTSERSVSARVAALQGLARAADPDRRRRLPLSTERSARQHSPSP